MDQKTPSSLDPKLKEVYDRVMNTKVTPPSSPPVGLSQPATAPPSQTPSLHSNPPPPLASTGGPAKSAVDYAGLSAAPQTPPSQPTPPAAGHDNPAVKVVVSPSSTTYGVVNSDDKKKTAEPRKSGSAVKTLLIAGGILFFFVAYTVVWFLVFGIELPFGLAS